VAVLGRLVDPGPPAPSPRPSYARLLADAVAAKGRALRGLPAAVRSLRRATAAGGGLHSPTAAPCSVVRPTSGRSRFAVVRTDLTALLAAGHRAGGTLNDALLAAVAGALAALLERRGESVETLVLAVLVNARRSGTADELGNAATPLLVSVPTGGTGRERLRRIAGTVRAVRPTADGPSMIAGVGPLFRLLARAGLYRRYIEHQHRLHTLVSDVPGPHVRLAFDGAPIRAIVPVSVGDAGNVTVNFLALSYADVLTVTVVADPEAVPDLRILAALLQAELDALVGEPVAR
jgi:diacylglycerol O-acyltransferase